MCVCVDPLTLYSRLFGQLVYSAYLNAMMSAFLSFAFRFYQRKREGEVIRTNSSHSLSQCVCVCVCVCVFLRCGSSVQRCMLYLVLKTVPTI